jgi:hypothetical protein
VVRGGDGGADQRAHPEDPLHKTQRTQTRMDNEWW